MGIRKSILLIFKCVIIDKNLYKRITFKARIIARKSKDWSLKDSNVLSLESLASDCLQTSLRS